MESTPGKTLVLNSTFTYVDISNSLHDLYAMLSPGRFFAANELKAMLGYIVLNFDVKLEGDGKRPENVHRGPTVVPSPSARVFFRKRPASE